MAHCVWPIGRLFSTITFKLKKGIFVKEFSVNGLLKNSQHYTELRAQRNKTSTIAFLNGDLVNNEESVSSGLSCRTFVNGEWGFASTSMAKTDSVDELIKKAETNAMFMAKMKKEKGEEVSLKNTSFNFEKDYTGAGVVMTQADIIDYGKELCAYIKEKYPDLKSSQVIVAFNELEKNLTNSFGSQAYHILPRTVLYTVFSYEKDDEVVSVTGFFGRNGRPGDVLNRKDEINEKIETLYKHVIDKANGVHATAGVKDVIVSPAVTGVLAHEAIGHPAEADLVKAGSVAGNYIDEKVGTDLVTMIDYAHTYNGEELPVPVYIDDEGVEGKDAVLIDKGVFKGFMNNRELAGFYNAEETGNARAFAYNDEPLIRMRNTIIEPGESKLEDMISEIKDGYYFIERSNGQADLTSEFMFGVTMGYEIKNGKLGKAVKDTTISGVAFDMLKTVDMVSDEFHVGTTGFCGKKQRMIVSHGGPSLKCKVHVGGK